ncbi:DNA alkylation repair protein [Flavobacterium sp. I3-2]|uniref:DNA alkylation repair protein n=1 Tax=Flavobacterium sp. I3-2 TaxID=2748319 RepID=UPI0015AF6EA0|nr:DNA alkylation repair protein [Flavobacterium sp. I3-2]
MKLSEKALEIYNQIKDEQTKLGDLRKMASAIKKDHELALELWNTQNYFAQQLAILIMDKKLLNQEIINVLCNDIEKHSKVEKLNLMDWLMANQLMKDKKTIALIESWLDSTSSLQRRTFWYYQGRLRWVGQTPPPNSEELLSLIENRIEKEIEEVQWAMNFTAAQIGIFQEEYRNRCITLGEKTGLYKDEVAPKNCTPNYLPNYISIQVEKIKKQ